MRGRTLQIAVNSGTSASPTWVTIAQATSHKLSYSTQTSDVSTKDIGKVKDITGRSWNFSTDNLICNYNHDQTARGYHAKQIIGKLKGQEIEIRLQYVVLNGPQDDENEGDEEQAITLLTGKARVTKMDLNFQNKENASYTAEFQGIGKPTIPA